MILCRNAIRLSPLTENMYGSGIMLQHVTPALPCEAVPYKLLRQGERRGREEGILRVILRGM